MDTQSIVTSKMGVQKIGRRVSEELPRVKDANVNFRDRLNNVLGSQKHSLINYQTAINEALNDDLRGLLMDNRNRIQDAHIWIASQLFDMGEYQADTATTHQIMDIYDIFNGYKTQLPLQQ